MNPQDVSLQVLTPASIEFPYASASFGPISIYEPSGAFFEQTSLSFPLDVSDPFLFTTNVCEQARGGTPYPTDECEHPRVRSLQHQKDQPEFQYVPRNETLSRTVWDTKRFPLPSVNQGSPNPFASVSPAILQSSNIANDYSSVSSPFKKGCTALLTLDR